MLNAAKQNTVELTATTTFIFEGLRVVNFLMVDSFEIPSRKDD